MLKFGTECFSLPRIIPTFQYINKNMEQISTLWSVFHACAFQSCVTSKGSNSGGLQPSNRAAMLDTSMIFA